jgi:hypothetical protein
MVQEAYHHGHTNKPQWPSQYCWPEGFMRRWHEAALWEHHILVTPKMVQIPAGVRNFITQIHVGREFTMGDGVPRLGADVPRWYGETIGFWDGDALITWTSNIQGWMTHAAFEHANQMQTVEIYSPNRDANGAFLGLTHEAIFYDPEALVEPVLPRSSCAPIHSTCTTSKGCQTGAGRSDTTCARPPCRRTPHRRNVSPWCEQCWLIISLCRCASSPARWRHTTWLSRVRMDASGRGSRSRTSTARP